MTAQGEGALNAMFAPPLKASLVLLLFLFPACAAYSYQLQWPPGATAAQYKKDSEECDAETRTGFAELTNEMGSVATSMADDDMRRLWNRCMASRGYELVKVPRNAATPSPPPAR